MIEDLERDLDTSRGVIKDLKQTIEDQNDKIIQMEENIFEMESI